MYQDLQGSLWTLNNMCTVVGDIMSSVAWWPDMVAAGVVEKNLDVRLGSTQSDSQ